MRGTARGATERVVAAAAALALLVVAAVPAAGEFDFTGPAPTRNFQPIQLIFLNLPFESALTVQPGEIAFLLSTAEINEIATTQGPIDSVLKFESNRTNFGLRYGFLEDWEAGLDLPFISRYGGFLDPLIDAFESAFNSKNSERSLFPQNSFGAFSVTRGNTELFQASEENFQPGDLVLSVKRALRLPPAWPRLALRGAIKMPTGDAGAVLGSGKPDFGAGFAADYQALSRLMFYFNFDVVYPVGPITAGDLTLNPFVDESFAIHLAITQGLSAMLHQATYTSPFHTGTRLLDGTVVELGFGLNYAFGDTLGVQLLGIENMSGVEQSADFTLMLSMLVRPWAQPTTLPPLESVPPPAARDLATPGPTPSPTP